MPLPVVNLNLRDFYDSAIQFFALRSPALSSLSALFTDVAGGDGASSSSSSSDSTTNFSLTLAGPPAPPVSAAAQLEGPLLRENVHVAEQRPSDACPSSALTDTTPVNQQMRGRELDAARADLARSRNEISRLEDRCRALERTLKDTRDLLRARDLELQRTKRGSGSLPPPPDRRRSNDRASEISVRLRAGDDAISVDGSDGRSSVGTGPASSADAASSTSAEEERAHAASLDAFLAKVDRWSGAQVIQTVHDLNSEILQFAAAATETCAFERTSRSPPLRVTQAAQETSARLGQNLVHVLSTQDNSQDPIMVQLAIQGCVCTCIARAMSTFCLGFQTKANTLLAQLYGQMALTEPQPTSSRWRALTHKHIHTLHPDLEEYSVTDLSETVLRWSSDVLALAGCPDADASRDTLRARFGPQVRRVARATARLAAVTREEIMSAGFEVRGAEAGAPFDARAMEDAFAAYAPSAGPVLCATELGLQCVTRRAEGMVERRMLLRPKVILQSVIDVLDPK